MLNIFLAGSLDRINQINYLAQEIKQTWGLNRPGSSARLSFDVVSTWHISEDSSLYRLTLNLKELIQADILIIDLYAPSTSGGYHYEAGMADLAGTKIFTVGSPIPHGYLSLYRNFDMYRDLRDYLLSDPAKLFSNTII